MAKKQRNKQERFKTLFEISILLPAFQFIYAQMKQLSELNVHDEEKLIESFPEVIKNAGTILKKLARVIRTHAAMQSEAIDMSTEALGKLSEQLKSTNSFYWM